MPKCCVCCRDVPRANFNVAQLGTDAGERKCKECTGACTTNHSAQAQLNLHDAAQYGDIVEERPRSIIHIAHSTENDKLERLRTHAAAVTLVAFDAEWDPHSDESAGVHVLQLAFPEPPCVYVLQIRGIGESMPSEVYNMFVRPTCKVFGWGVQKDRIRLAHTAPQLRALHPHHIFDIQNIAGARISFLECGEALNAGPLGPRLDAAASKLLGFHLSKDLAITTSNWDSPSLSQLQVQYAAMDAWVTLRLYLALCEGLTAAGTILASVDSELASAHSMRSLMGLPELSAAELREQQKRYLLQRNQTCELCGLGGITSDKTMAAHLRGKKCMKLQSLRASPY